MNAADDDPELYTDESTSFLSSGKTPSSPHRQSLRRRYIIPLVYMTVLLFMVGESILPAPQTEIFETILCLNHYAKVGFVPAAEDRRCKAREIQEELALLRGVQRLSGLLPMLLAVPYGIAADRYGRAFIMTLALGGITAKEIWGFVVCWYSDLFPIRLIWLQFVFELFGGGSSVASTMAHIIVADVVPAHERTNTFFRIYAVGIVGAITAQLCGSLLMKFNPWTPWFIGLLCLVGCATLSTTIPNSTNEEALAKATVSGISNVQEPSYLSERSGSTPTRILTAISRVRRRLITLMKRNPQVPLLLFISFICQLGDASLPLVLLLYISKKFDWDFADANLIWSLGEGVQLAQLVVFLPLVSNFLLLWLGMSIPTKDLSIAHASSAVLALGSLLLGFAPRVGLAIAGVVFMSAGAGVGSILRSLLTEIIAPNDISMVYSVMTVLAAVSNSVAGPIYSGAFAAGLRLGNDWIGLPFIVSGVLFVLACAVIPFVKKPDDDPGPGVPRQIARKSCCS